MANEWRPEELLDERTRRIHELISPNLGEGRTPLPGLVPESFGPPPTTVRDGVGGGSLTIKHMQELLTTPDDEGRYEMTYVPLPYWPHCWVDGIMQRIDVDFEINGKFLTPLPEMDLDPDLEEIWVGYDYIYGEVADDGDPGDSDVLTLDLLEWLDEPTIVNPVGHQTRFYVTITNHSTTTLTGYYLYAKMVVNNLSTPPTASSNRNTTDPAYGGGSSYAGDAADINPVTIPPGTTVFELVAGFDTVYPNVGALLSFAVTAVSSATTAGSTYQGGTGTEYTVTSDTPVGGWGPANGNRPLSFTWWPGREGTPEPTKL